MVSQFPMHPMYRTTPLTVDTSQAQRFFDEEDNSLLEDGVLSSSGLDSGLEMSPPMVESRRESFAVSSSMFSPKAEDWQSVEMQSVPSNHSFLDQPTNNPFLQQPTPFGHQNTGAWSLSNGSGTCTPLQQFDGLPADYDGNATSIFQRPMQGQPGPFGIPAGQISMFSAMNSNTSSLATSPQREWLAQSQSMAKKMRPNSPTLRSHNDMRRGDGIRKKNARFDIPAERNLNNIDHLIAQSTDEQEIKELKQQKRLLRNRQAALDSRQRKKQHTERLEDEKKHFTVVISELEEQVDQLRLQNTQLSHQSQGFQNYIDGLVMEKEERIRAHTLETAELRKKISVLTDEVQRLQGAGMASGMQGNNAFGNGYDDMDGMTMTGTWDNGGFLGDFPVEPEVKAENQLVKKAEITFPTDADKPANQSGLIFWLFLIGAFVISKGSAPSIPRVSEDVRATSATLLESVLKDAGVGSAPTGVEAMAPQPSGSAWSGPSTLAGSDMTMDGGMPTMLGDIGDSLTQPTREQANEQVFSLSAAQFNGVNPQEFLQNAPPPPRISQGRRNLADALAAMRTTNKASTADVYSRSLLWDQIPSDVVRSFAKMVAECNGSPNEQRTDSRT